eukprot:g38907.t1
MLLLQFLGGVVVTLEEAKDGHVAQEVGWGGELKWFVTGKCCCLSRTEHRQHGFLQGRLRLTSSIELFENVTRMIDEGRAVDIVYMDFTKALIKYLMEDWYKSYSLMGSRVLLEELLQLIFIYSAGPVLLMINGKPEDVDMRRGEMFSNDIAIKCQG